MTFLREKATCWDWKEPIYTCTISVCQWQLRSGCHMGHVAHEFITQWIGA